MSLIPEFSGGDGGENVQTFESDICPPPTSTLHSRGHVPVDAIGAVATAQKSSDVTAGLRQTSLLICGKKKRHRSVFRIRDILVRIRMLIQILTSD